MIEPADRAGAGSADWAGASGSPPAASEACGPADCQASRLQVVWRTCSVASVPDPSGASTTGVLRACACLTCTGSISCTWGSLNRHWLLHEVLEGLGILQGDSCHGLQWWHKPCRQGRPVPPQVREVLHCRLRRVIAASDGDAAKQVMGQPIHFNFVRVDDRAHSQAGRVRCGGSNDGRGPNGWQVVVQWMEQGHLHKASHQRL